MRRRIVGTVVSVGLGFAYAGAGVADDEPPPLAPPGAGSTPVPAPAAAPTPAAASRPSTGPVLAVPGSPGFQRLGGRNGLPTLEPAGSAATEDLPPLIGPSAMPAAPPGPALAPKPAAAANAAPVRVESNPLPAGVGPQGRPRVIESVPAGDSPDRPVSRSLAPRSSFLAPRRSPRLFSRFGVPPLVLGRGGADPGSSITVEPRSDPAAEAAVKRRVEKQIGDSFGDHLKSVEVRVVGRDVMIRARATRFWQRRSLRRSLEALPTASGYRTTVDLQ